MLWFTSAQSNWCQIEAKSCSSSSLQALVCSSLPSPSLYTSNPIVIGTLKIWAQIRRSSGWLTLPQTTPICNNHLFLPAKFDPRFTFVSRSGLRYFRDMHVNGCSVSFEQLRKTFNFSGSDFLRYFQLRDFTRTHSPQFPQIPPPSGIDLIIKAETLPNGHISYFYNLLSPFARTRDAIDVLRPLVI